MNKHFMIDIETTGTDRQKDSILQIALVEIEFKYPYWYLTGRDLMRTVHYSGQPESEFAKKHMAELYSTCNHAHPVLNSLEQAGIAVRNFIHTDFLDNDPRAFIHEAKPRYFMGWNASGFDLPFMFDKGLLRPSFYVTNPDTGKEEMFGDVHYRIYEQTGFLQGMSNMTGMTRDTLQRLAQELNPTNIVLPKGKSHDALYDCYKQIIMQNGLIAIGRMGVQKPL